MYSIMSNSILFSFSNISPFSIVLSISGVKSTITQAQANALMDTIIAKNIFLPTAGALTKKESAQLTERKVTKYEVA